MPEGPLTKAFSKAKGIRPTPEPSIMQRFLNLATGYPLPGEQATGVDVLTSGLPFASYIPKLGRNFLLHGTARTFDKFDPSRGATSDILGHYQPHATPSNRYAETYSGKYHGQGKYAPRLIPIQPEARNVLDLMDPNIDDLGQALASLTPRERSFLVAKYKSNRSFSSPEESKRDLAFQLRDRLNNPEVVKRLPFDAIRYDDLGEEAWTFPHSTVLKTPWGTPLTQEQKPLKLFKHFKETGAQAKLAPDRWENTPLSLPEQPHPEIMKLKEAGEYIVFNILKGSKSTPISFNGKKEAIDFINSLGIKGNQLDYLPIDEYIKLGH